MNNRPPLPPTSWRQSVSPPPHRPPRQTFSRSYISMGAMIHIAGMIVGALAADKMKEPSTRWATIAGFGIATGIGETIWRNRIEREDREQDPRDR